jgi:tight adherence protein C
MAHAHALYSAAATLAFAIALSIGCHALARVPARPRPTLGPRGFERGAALRRLAWLRAIDPALRWLAASIARLPLDRVRSALERRCVHAGDALGLAADEWLALAGLAACAAACITACALRLIAIDARWPVAAAALIGAAWPFEYLRSRGAARARRVARELPATIDLISLCMGAGLDFTGALAEVARESGDADDPLARELSCVLRDLSLGETRARALSGFATRVPSRVVRDFTAAVIQAERMGNPLREAIEIQAQALRMQRSLVAEEAAARAAVLLAFPLLLLLAAIVLLMLGPFIVKGVAF